MSKPEKTTKLGDVKLEDRKEGELNLLRLEKDFKAGGWFFYSMKYTGLAELGPPPPPPLEDGAFFPFPRPPSLPARRCGCWCGWGL